MGVERSCRRLLMRLEDFSRGILNNWDGLREYSRRELGALIGFYAAESIIFQITLTGSGYNYLIGTVYE